LDRLEAVLEKSKPDFVFACYGMTDGLYAPFDEQRFDAYKQGIRELIATVKGHGAKLVLITPPPFDTLAMKKKGKLSKSDATGFTRTSVYENYDQEVIAKYAAWITELEDDPGVYAVVDAYSVMKQYILNRRWSNPDFTFSPDGVHFHAAGHRVMANAILNTMGFESELVTDRDILGLIRERLAYSHMTWLTHVGHDHPKLPSSLTFEELEIKMKPVNERIEKYLDEHRAK
jgi:lysophospholipase L1-like esterase